MDIPTLVLVLKTDKTVYLLSFALAAVLAIWPGNLFVKHIHRMAFDRVPKSAASQEFIELEFRSVGAAWIGRVERVIYVFGIMFGQSGVITAVIILKAFFNWTDKFLAMSQDQNADIDARKQNYTDIISNYHVYLVGNLLSIIVGLFWGEVGIWAFPRLIFFMMASHRADVTCTAACAL